MTNAAAPTRSVPFGHSAYVVSDLALDASPASSTYAVDRLAALLRDIDGGATVIVAGNLFDDSVDDLAAVMHRHATFFAAIQTFTANAQHVFVVQPGSFDGALYTPDVVAHLAAFGIVVDHGTDLLLHAQSGATVVQVRAGEVVADATDSDDPAAQQRWRRSMAVYRRYRGLLWAGLLALVSVDALNTVTHLVDIFTHHHYRIHTLHGRNAADNVLLNLLVLVAIEAAIITAVSLGAGHRRGTPQLFSEPLEAVRLNGVAVMDATRAALALDVTGLIVGGARRPALAYLDSGFCAAPGAAQRTQAEYEAMLSLPSVFRAVDRFSYVEIEVASLVNVQLIGQEFRHPGATLIERLVMQSPAQPGLTESASAIGAWPRGGAFPLPVARLDNARRQRRIRRWASGLLFLDGLVNIAVTAAPPLRGRLQHVLVYLPLQAAQSAAAITALGGVALIMLARGIRRGQRRSWFFAQMVLAVTVLTHAARAGSLASSIVAAGLCGFLLVERRHFSAETDRASMTSAVMRTILVAVVAVLTSALGMEVAARHHAALALPDFPVVVMASVERLVGISVIYLPDGISDFVSPVLLAIGLALIIVLLYLLTRPVVDRRLSTMATTPERRLAEIRARDIVRRHGKGTLDYFALRDDKQFFFFRDSLVAYAVYGGVALVSPDPIGPVAERVAAFNAFRRYGESRGWTIGVMAASAEWLPLYHEAGYHSLYLGDEAIVDCQTFSLEGGKMKGLRQAYSRIGRYGYTAEFYDPATMNPRDVLDVLELVAMMRRGDDERGFSMMLGRLFDPKDKGLLMVLVRDPEGKPAAACQFVPSPAIQGYSLDLMRRDPGEHPNGLIDFALCSTIFHLRDQGATGLSLNFAAFRGVLDGERGEGTWTKIERWTLQRLSGALPIASLWTFNAKYQPRWLPRHIVYPAIESFVPVVSAILRAESMTEFPVIGKFFTNDPANRPGTVVPPEVLAAAQASRTTDGD